MSNDNTPTHPDTDDHVPDPNTAVVLAILAANGWDPAAATRSPSPA